MPSMLLLEAVPPMFKARIKQFLGWNLVAPVADLAQELIFQGIFDHQCRNHRIPNDYYPLGGAASYGMLYLLTRLLADEGLSEVVEFGSGQSTVLIDRVRPEKGYHLCFESDTGWHARIKPRLHRCEYLLLPIVSRTFESVTASTYDAPPVRDFDLILVDGPHGTPQHSRFGCAEWILGNRRESFVAIVDDTGRPGEGQTVAFIVERLRRSGKKVSTKQMRAKTVLTVIAVGDLAHATQYF
ncbi:MAG: hypothetical protein U1E89_03660 [Burkholderiaceae bacterium]